MRYRSTVMGRGGMVSSSHPLASLAGLRILEAGGSIVDAVIATSATLAVVQNNMCGLGGDLFALLKIGDRVIGLNGSGRAGERATIDLYEKLGYTSIPTHGPLSAITVPGMVHAWGEMHKRYGRMELKTLLGDAILYAERGFPVSYGYAHSISSARQTLGRYINWAEIFLPRGEPPKPGDVLVQRDLASSLKIIAEEGCQTYYDGDLADKIISGIEVEGGILTEEDFRRHTTTWDEPLTTDYRGVKVYETAPNSQAATVLLWLNMLEEFDLPTYRPDSAELLVLLFRTCRLAYRERAKWIADPEYLKLPDDFLSKEYAKKLLGDTSLKPTNISPPSGGEGDTTYFAVMNGEGECASVIQSNYMGFGSGVVPKGTGLVLHNRGCYFTLKREHHNSLRPNKRTFHTLCASVGLVDNETRFCLGSMGGDVQPQVHVQLITRLVDYGMDIQEAIDAPRWAATGTIYDQEQEFHVEEDYSGLLPTLAKAGFTPKITPRFSSLMGHAQGIVRLPNGSLMGGADPRGDGAALGY
ncbi:MAG: gamma-glutamyltransferase [Thermoprotei archaeon]